MEYLSILAIAVDQTSLVKELSSLATKHECSIELSRMNKVESEFAISMLLSGKWSGIAKIEANMAALEKKFEMKAIVKRIKPQDEMPALLPYTAQMLGLNQTGIIYEISSFFTNQNIPILELQSNTLNSSQTHTKLLSIALSVGIPVDISIAELREHFLILCDELNIDGILEPEKR